MIFKDSRYMNQPVIMVPGGDGTSHPTVFGPPVTMVNKFFPYQVREGDRFDLIADYFFQRPDLWWYIANANPEVFYPGELLPGSIIRIPGSA
jgi:hypothetical protein